MNEKINKFMLKSIKRIKEFRIISHGVKNEDLEILW